MLTCSIVSDSRPMSQNGTYTPATQRCAMLSIRNVEQTVTSLRYNHVDSSANMSGTVTQDANDGFRVSWNLHTEGYTLKKQSSVSLQFETLIGTKLALNERSTPFFFLQEVAASGDGPKVKERT